MRLVRIFFEKRGRARYISHLDLNRTFMRCLKKARIPVWYTEGFNPHPFVSFALPLTLGAESLYETADIKMEDAMPNDEIKTRLSAAMPEGLVITDVAEAIDSPNDISAVKYVITFHSSESEVEKLKKSIEEILSGEELLAEKLAKKGKKKIMKQINLIEYLGERNIEVLNNDVILNITMSAGIKKSLNPTLFTETVCKKAGIESYKADILKKYSVLENMEKFR